MDINIIIGVSTFSIAAIVAAYMIGRSAANKNITKYKNIYEAIKSKQIVLNTTLKELDLSKRSLKETNKETKELQSLKSSENKIRRELEENTKKLKDIARDIENKTNTYKNITLQFKQLESKLDLYTRINEFVEVGHFEIPEYIHETSERFSEEIKIVRKKQKDMIREKKAVTYPASTTISNDSSHNKKILDGQVKLMLSAFNIECDTLISKVNPSNFSRTLERIENIANVIEKSASTLHCGFNIQYIALKYEECKLQYQNSIKKKEEQEEQHLIREKIREEQKAIKEYGRAIAQAEKEEKLYRTLLERARNELLKATGYDRIATETRIAELEFQLAEAEAKEARAKSMAEQTRKGHVYIISNIGSFGEHVYKIGLTRRLEPMDRVKELGGASVPFPFDVHALIYTDDAPALEASLHREFTHSRVNAVNLRKEFFRVDLESIKEAVERISGISADFKMTALAEGYYESKRLQGTGTQDKKARAIPQSQRTAIA